MNLEAIKNFIQKFGYILFAVFCLIIFIYLRFPYEVVLTRIINLVEPQLSRDGSIRISANDLSPYRLLGVSLYDFKILQNGEPIFQAKKVSARLRILPLLTGSKSIAFYSKSFGGSLKGHLGMNDESMFGKIYLKKINLQNISYLKTKMDVPVRGILKGKITFSFDSKKIQNSILDGDLSLDKGLLGPGQIKGFELPAKGIRLDDKNKPIPITLSLKDSQLTPSIKFSNDDLSLDLKGTIRAHPRMDRSRLDLQVKFSFGNQIKDQLPSIFFDNLLKPAENSDGSYGYKISGQLRRPRINPFKT